MALVLGVMGSIRFVRDLLASKVTHLFFFFFMVSLTVGIFFFYLSFDKCYLRINPMSFKKYI